MEEKEPVRIEGLKHEDIVIGTSESFRLTGNNNLCVVIDVVEGFMEQEQQFLMSMNPKKILENQGTPAVLRMHEDFEFNNNEGDVKQHELYKFTEEFTKPFYEFNFGARVPALKNPEHGTPIYIGKDKENVHVAYISSEKYNKDLAPVAKFPIAVVLGHLDQGKKKIKVRYITIEDDTVTVNVVSMDRITDMKELIYQIG